MDSLEFIECGNTAKVASEVRKCLGDRFTVTEKTLEQTVVIEPVREWEVSMIAQMLRRWYTITKRTSGRAPFGGVRYAGKWYEGNE